MERNEPFPEQISSLPALNERLQQLELELRKIKEKAAVAQLSNLLMKSQETSDNGDDQAESSEAGLDGTQIDGASSSLIQGQEADTNSIGKTETNDETSRSSDDVVEEKNPFDLLPNELVTVIFQHFTYAQRTLKFSMVCRRFRDVVRQMTPNFFDRLPNEIVLRVFDTFGIRERASVLSKICKRFHQLVTGGGEGISDVYVLNVFEEHIWENSVSRNNHSNKQTIIRLPDADHLGDVFKYLKAMSAAKIWYESPDFGKRVIDELSESRIKMSCVDVYPYAPEEILDHLEAKIPGLEAITMRPHGAPLWNGVPMTQMPPFQHLRTLIIDGFEIDSSIKFPPNVSTFDFSSRANNNAETPQWMMVMPKLAHMPHLEFVSLSHVRLNTVHDFVAFIQFLGPDFLPQLKFLVLKFCKFPQLTGVSDEQNRQEERNRFRRAARPHEAQENQQPEEETPPKVLENDFKKPVLSEFSTSRPFLLQWLKIELCDGNLAELLSVFTTICSGLQMVLLSVIGDLEYLRDINTAAPILEAKRIWTHLSFLTKSPINYPHTQSPFRKILPSPSLFGITTKIEASFADDPHFFDTYLMGGNWHRVHEVKLISCPAASNQFIEHISENSKFLRKLTVIRCRNVDEEGMSHFVENLHNRQRDLMITWKRDKLRSRPSGFYLHMCTKREKLEGKAMRFKTKTFPEGDGEEVVVIERETNRIISLRDFDENDAGRLISICVKTPFSERRKEEIRLQAEKEKREEEERQALLKIKEELIAEPPNYQPPPPPPLQSEAEPEPEPQPETEPEPQTESQPESLVEPQNAIQETDQDHSERENHSQETEPEPDTLSK